MNGAETGKEPDEAELATEVVDGGTESDEGPEAGHSPDAGEASDAEEPMSEPASEAEVARPNRKPAFFGLARVAVVLAVAAGGYFLVVPTHHDRQTRIVTSRLSQLAIASPGVTGFNDKPQQSAVQQASEIGITALTNAAKNDPGHTGVYARSWTKAKQGSDAIVVFAILLPTESEAQTVLGGVDKQVLAKNAEASNSLKQTSTFAVTGLDGSHGAIYEPTKPTKTSQVTVVTTFRQGRVVNLVQAAETTNTAAGRQTTQAHVESVSKAQAAHLRTLSPGFNLVELVRPAGTSYPATASIVWIAGSLVVASVAGLAPVWYRRSRRRREARRQAELDRMIFVRGQTITKRRR